MQNQIKVLEPLPRAIETPYAEPNLGQDSEDSQRRAAAAFDFHGNGVNRRIFCRQAVQVSDIFKDRQIRRAKYLMRGEFLRGSVIDARGIDTDGFDTPSV